MNNQQYVKIIIKDSKDQIKILEERILAESDPDQKQAFENKISKHKFMIDRLKHFYT